MTQLYEMSISSFTVDRRESITPKEFLSQFCEDNDYFLIFSIKNDKLTNQLSIIYPKIEIHFNVFFILYHSSKLGIKIPYCNFKPNIYNPPK